MEYQHAIAKRLCDAWGKAFLLLGRHNLEIREGFGSYPLLLNMEEENKIG